VLRMGPQPQRRAPPSSCRSGCRRRTWRGRLQSLRRSACTRHSVPPRPSSSPAPPSRAPPHHGSGLAAPLRAPSAGQASPGAVIFEGPDPSRLPRRREKSARRRSATHPRRLWGGGGGGPCPAAELHVHLTLELERRRRLARGGREEPRARGDAGDDARRSGVGDGRGAHGARREHGVCAHHVLSLPLLHLHHSLLPDPQGAPARPPARPPAHKPRDVSD